MNNNTLDFILYLITTNHILTIIWIFDMLTTLMSFFIIHYYHSFILLSLTLSVNITNIITDIEIMVHKV